MYLSMPRCAHSVSDLVICLSALWKDLLVCVSLSCQDSVSAWDSARNQLKTFFLEALVPEGFCLGCPSCHGVPADGGHVHDPGSGHDSGGDPCVPVHDVWAGKDWGGLWACPLCFIFVKHGAPGPCHCCPLHLSSSLSEVEGLG